MALKSGLFDSTEVRILPGGMAVGNKAQDAAFFAKYLSSFFGNGVFQEKNGGFQAQTDDGMSVTVSAGKAYINGYFCYDDSTYTESFAADTAEHTYWLILRLDLSEGEISREWIADPQEGVVPIRDAQIYDLVLAKLCIPANVTALTAAMLTDTRQDAALCGFVSAIESEACLRADRLSAPRSISLTGAVTAGPASFDGTADVVLEADELDLSDAVGTLPISKGGTGATSAVRARSYLGCAAVSHTHNASDISGTLNASMCAAGGTDYSALRLRNISVVSAAPTELANGMLAAVISGS